MRFVMIGVVIIPVGVGVRMGEAFSVGFCEIVKVRFREKMEANVVDVNKEKRCGKQVQPPRGRARSNTALSVCSARFCYGPIC